jgi:hypothetical protein
MKEANSIKDDQAMPPHMHLSLHKLYTFKGETTTRCHSNIIIKVTT